MSRERKSLVDDEYMAKVFETQAAETRWPDWRAKLLQWAANRAQVIEECAQICEELAEGRGDAAEEYAISLCVDAIRALNKETK